VVSYHVKRSVGADVTTLAHVKDGMVLHDFELVCCHYIFLRGIEGPSPASRGFVVRGLVRGVIDAST